MTGSTPKIAIVEDDAAILQMYRMKFEAEGFKVGAAGDGASGLKVIEDLQPDMILLDLMMPEMNGDEVLTKLRKTDWGKNATVIILTNMGREEAPKSLESLNVDSYIVKAEMTPKQVAEVVKKKLGQA